MNPTHPNNEKLAAFAEGTLPEPDASTVENHVAQCETCASALDRLPVLERLAGKLRQQPQSDQLDVPVRAWIEGMKRIPPALPAARPAAKQSKVPEPLVRTDEPKHQAAKATASFDSEAVSTPSAARSSNDADQLPNQFGRYRILKKIGRGGMGAVYLAHDTKLDRQVALKVPRFSPDDGPEILDRFYREARSAATLDHPNICQVHDVGEFNGIHYISMAFIDGKTLSEWIPEPAEAASSTVQQFNRSTVQPPTEFLPERQVAAVIRKLAQALDYAHSRGIVHRDLKPSNIMVNQHRQLVIMDFDLAKRLPVQSPASQAGAAAAPGDAASQHGTPTTFSGQIIGTPAYMSPEQALGDTKSIGPASDIYSLGVIMYEMLTGRLPFEGPLAAVLGQIMVSDPPRPSTLRPNLDPTLEALFLKAISKKPTDRFASMSAFAKTLGDFLTAPTKQAAYATKTASKQIATPRSPSGSFVGDQALAQFFEQLEAEKEPPQAAALPRTVAYHSRSKSIRNAVAVAAVLFACCFGGWKIWVRTGEGTIKIELPDPTDNVKVIVDGNEVRIENLGEPIALKAGKHDLVMKRGDLEVRTQSFMIHRGTNAALLVSYEPSVPEKKDESPLSPKTLSKQETTKPNKTGAKETKSERSVAPASPLGDLAKQIERAAQQPRSPTDPTDNETVERRAALIDALRRHRGTPEGFAAVREMSRLAWPVDQLNRDRLLSHALQLAGGGDSRQAPPKLVSVLGDGRLMHWNIAWSVVFSPDGQTLASGGQDRSVVMWDPATGDLKRRFDTSESVTCVAFHPDGTTLVSAQSDGKIAFWDLTTGAMQKQQDSQLKTIDAVMFSPRGDLLGASGRALSGHGQLVLWEVASGDIRLSLSGLSGDERHATFFAFDSDGEHVASWMPDNEVRVWDVTTGGVKQKIAGPHASRISRILISPNNEFLVTGYERGSVKLWDLSSGNEQHMFPAIPHTGPMGYQVVTGLAFTPDGKTLARAGHWGALRLVEIDTKGERRVDGHPYCINSLCFSPDGNTLASASQDYTVALWNVADGTRKVQFQRPRQRVRTVAISPDGLMLASGGFGFKQPVMLWDVASAQLRKQLDGHWGDITSVDFSSDGKRVASVSAEQRVLIHDTATGALLHDWKGATGRTTHFARKIE